jgi:RNA polymerase sigma-70 factor (ECF subfamily)
LLKEVEAVLAEERMEIGMSQDGMSAEALFTELMERSYKKVFNLAYRLSGNRADAEDLTQEAYVRAFRSFDSYDPSKPFENWIFRIVSRLFLDLLRYRRRRVKTVSFDAPMQADGADDDVYFDSADERENPEEVLVNNSLSEAMEWALSTLSDEHRTLVVLADIQGLPYAEISEIIGAPVGTIRSRLHRIHKTLRARLTEWEERHALQPGGAVPALQS